MDRYPSVKPISTTACKHQLYSFTLCNVAKTMFSCCYSSIRLAVSLGLSNLPVQSRDEQAGELTAPVTTVNKVGWYGRVYSVNLHRQVSFVSTRFHLYSKHLKSNWKFLKKFSFEIRFSVKIRLNPNTSPNPDPNPHPNPNPYPVFERNECEPRFQITSRCLLISQNLHTTCRGLLFYVSRQQLADNPTVSSIRFVDIVLLFLNLKMLLFNKVSIIVSKFDTQSLYFF